MIRAIAFDLDDTLYPEVQFVYSGYRAVSEAVRQQLGFEIDDDLVALFEAGQRGDLFTPVLQMHLGPVEEAFIRQLIEVYRQHKPTLRPFPEVRKVLEELKPSYRLAIVSDGWLGVQDRKLQALQIRPYFDVVVFSDKWGRDCWKPHPYAYEECARLLSLNPTSMVYVGDNPTKDFIAPCMMGMKTIRVRRTGTLHYHVHLPSEFEADYEASNLEGIPALLQVMEH